MKDQCAIQRRIQVLIPSFRPLQLVGTLDSLICQARSPELVQIVVGLDEGDLEASQQILRYRAMKAVDTDITFRWLPVTTPFDIRTAYNMMAQPRPACIVNLNDDCLMMTPGWDQLLMMMPIGTLGLIHEYDNATEGSFTVIPSDHLERWGCLYPDFLAPAWGTDRWLLHEYRERGPTMQLPITVLHLRSPWNPRYVRPDDSEQVRRWAEAPARAGAGKTPGDGPSLPAEGDGKSS